MLIFINIKFLRDKMEKSYKISEVAEILGVSIHTIRMYEKEGLVIPAKGENNQRRYTESDINRLICIRKSINESKISIRGLKAIYSLIPCWEIIKCSEEDRQNCPAYISTTKPCWMTKGKQTVCGNMSCRECEVYKTLSDCTKVKDIIKKTRSVR
jgi:MerR family transcriptional regulator/heat shock protein HspR